MAWTKRTRAVSVTVIGPDVLPVSVGVDEQATVKANMRAAPLTHRYFACVILSSYPTLESVES